MGQESYPEKRLVFADEQHRQDYDRKYEEYLESLGEQQPKWEGSFVEGIFPSNEHFGLAGHGDVTSEVKRSKYRCGEFLYYETCSHPENHGIDLVGGDFRNKTVVHMVYHHCDKPSCPICYKMGWAYREANKIAMILKKFSEGFKDIYGLKHASLGLPEHGVISVPPSDYGLSYDKLKAKVLKVAYSRGFIGGNMVFHPFRYRKYDVYRGGIRRMRGWFFAPHWHVLGFLKDNYGKCRSCPRMDSFAVKTGSGRVVKRIGDARICYGCDGFEAKVRRLGFGDIDEFTGKPSGYYFDSKGKKRKADGYVVRVFGERKNVFGTALYELSHAGYRIGVKRFHPSTWFGVCNSNKLVFTKEFHKRCCPICNSKMVAAKYFGKDLFERFDFYACTDFVVDLFETDKEGNKFLAWVPDDSVKNRKFV